MSRVGAAPVDIPRGVSVECGDKKIIIASSGIQKELSVCDGVFCNVSENQIIFSIDDAKKDVGKVKSMWGTFRSNVSNIIKGMVNDFSVNLEINGVGYKAGSDGICLTLYLGYSHAIKYKVPEGVTIKCVKPTQLVVSGRDKQKVCMVASDLCRVRKYDPYKGKGIVISGKFMLRKVVTKKK